MDMTNKDYKDFNKKINDEINSGWENVYQTIFGKRLEYRNGHYRVMYPSKRGWKSYNPTQMIKEGE